MLHPADDLIYRFRTTMASSGADDAQADLAELIRSAAGEITRTNPSDAEFREGVQWAVAELERFADEIASHRPTA